MFSLSCFANLNIDTVKNFLDFNVWLNTPTSFQDLIDLRDEVSEINDEPSLIDGLRFFSKWIAHSY